MNVKGFKTRMKIADAAIKLCEHTHYHEFTLRMLEEASGCAFAVVRYHFPTMKTLQDCMMSRAIQTESLTVLAMGLADKNDIARNAPKKLKMKALKHLDWVG